MTTSDRVSSTNRSEPNLLGIYLNDHLAVATGEVELARRLVESQSGSSIGDTLERLATEIRQDRAALIDIMAAIGVPVRHVKSYLAWVAEKMGRLKLNGYVLRRSPLSGLVELEALRLGAEGRAAAWRTLRGLADHDRRLDAGRLDELLARAHRQIGTLEELGARTATEIFDQRRRP